VLDRLSDALDKALDDDVTGKRMAALASDIPAKPRRGQQALQALVKSEIARWTPVIQAAKVRVE
jgi:tripartite-type tricarboxylate transporter receptor subunit TctC